MRIDAALASLHAGQAQFLLGRYTEGHDQANLAISLLDYLVKEEPTNAEYRLTLAQSQRYQSYSDAGESAASVPASSESGRFQDLEKALELLNAPLSTTQKTAATAQNWPSRQHLGKLLVRPQRLDMAETAYRHPVEWYGLALRTLAVVCGR